MGKLEVFGGERSVKSCEQQFISYLIQFGLKSDDFISFIYIKSSSSVICAMKASLSRDYLNHLDHLHEIFEMSGWHLIIVFENPREGIL